MTVNGQVDQGSSDNKGLRLDVGLENYADLEDLDEEDPDDDDLVVTYDTDAGTLPAVELKLRDIPEGTMEGTFAGVVYMTGDLEGGLDFDLTLAGTITSDGGDGVSRVPDSCAISGTVTNEGGGVYDVDLTL